MGKQVLIIDDERELTEMLSTHLTRKGYECSVANNCKHAVELFDAGNFDLVLTDLQMPDGSGKDLTAKFQASNKSTVIFWISGFVDPEVRKEAEAAKVGALLNKPYRLREIIELIENALRD